MIRVNGKNWRSPRQPFRSATSASTSAAGKKDSSGTKSVSAAYTRRLAMRTAMAATKAKEREMKEEAEAERQRRVQAIKDRRERKAERERWEEMAKKMHHKKVERRRRREKRNKLLSS